MIIKLIIILGLKLFFINYFYDNLNYFNIFLIFNLSKNILTPILLNYALKKVNFINIKNNNSKNNKIPYPYIVYISFMETLIIYIIKKNIIFNEFIFYKDILYGFFISFIYDFLYDAVHYPIHYLLHKNKFLYSRIHKIHHSYDTNSIYARFYNHPLDYVLTELIPILFSIYIIRKIFNYVSLNSIMYIHIVRNMNDLFGHSGKEINIDAKIMNYFSLISFYNLITLTTITGFLNTMILTKNHNYHHINNYYNFSSRTILFDKIFNTFRNY